MTMTPVPGLTTTAANPQQLSTDGASANNGDFLGTLQDALSQVSDLQSEADSRVAQLLNGNGQDIHSAMIAVEKANLTFQMMVQVRNKIVQAYQQISAMPF